jgi:hypothetical protein
LGIVPIYKNFQGDLNPGDTIMIKKKYFNKKRARLDCFRRETSLKMMGSKTKPTIKTTAYFRIAMRKLGLKKADTVPKNYLCFLQKKELDNIDCVFILKKEEIFHTVIIMLDSKCICTCSPTLEIAKASFKKQWIQNKSTPVKWSKPFLFSKDFLLLFAGVYPIKAYVIGLVDIDQKFIFHPEQNRGPVQNPIVT